MVKSQDCDYLSRDPIEIDFTSVTEENILESISALLNLISYGDSWVNLTPNDPEMLQPYLQLESNKGIRKFVKVWRNNKWMMNLLFIFLMQFYQSPSFKKQKLFRKKTKTMLNYL